MGRHIILNHICDDADIGSVALLIILILLCFDYNRWIIYHTLLGNLSETWKLKL